MWGEKSCVRSGKFNFRFQIVDWKVLNLKSEIRNPQSEMGFIDVSYWKDAGRIAKRREGLL